MITTTKERELITDSQSLVSAKGRFGYEIRVYDDGFGPLFIMRDSMGIMGIVRAQTWEDEFFPEANETVEEIVKDYGFRRRDFKWIHPLLNAEGDIDWAITREATAEDYERAGGRLKDGQFVRWDHEDTPDPEAWIDNALFQEAFGFRPNGANGRDVLKHGIYAKDLNGEYLDVLTAEMVAEMVAEFEIKEVE